MMNAQMELSFGNARLCPSASRRQRRLSRAQWWFDRMRRVVDCAFQGQAVPAPRSEQIWLPGANRSIDITATEQQICE